MAFIADSYGADYGACGDSVGQGEPAAGAVYRLILLCWATCYMLVCTAGHAQRREDHSGVPWYLDMVWIHLVAATIVPALFR